MILCASLNSPWCWMIPGAFLRMERTEYSLWSRTFPWLSSAESPIKITQYNNNCGIWLKHWAMYTEWTCYLIISKLYMINVVSLKSPSVCLYNASVTGYFIFQGKNKHIIEQIESNGVMDTKKRLFYVYSCLNSSENFASLCSWNSLVFG